MAIKTALTQKLGIAHPILLAPMDIVSDARLTAAVSAAGGLGLLGGGYGEERWLRRELEILGRSKGRFGVGFITWSLARQPALLDLVLEHRPAAVILSFGDPAPFVDRIKRAGALLICQVQTVAMAKEASAKGADILVAQGAEAGGHGVSRGVISLVPEVVDAVDSRIPVLACGGIADGRGLAAALMLGAAGVMIGTRFYACDEAAGPDAAKERIRAASGDDSLRSIVFDISRRNVWPAPYTGRCLRNPFLDRWYGREVDLMRQVDEEAARVMEARRNGDFEVAPVIAGESSGLVRDIRPAREIVEGIVRDAAAMLAGVKRQLEAA